MDMFTSYVVTGSSNWKLEEEWAAGETSKQASQAAASGDAALFLSGVLHLLWRQQMAAIT